MDSAADAVRLLCTETHSTCVLSRGALLCQSSSSETKTASVHPFSSRVYLRARHVGRKAAV